MAKTVTEKERLPRSGSCRIRGMNVLEKPGSYALVFACRRPIRVVVGALGDVSISPGYLVYVGSALGSGGLAGRLQHHLRPVNNPRWHVDYLRPQVSLVGVWWAIGPPSLEHTWASTLAGTRGFTVPQLGLGSSDCGCGTHLFHSGRRPIGRWMRAVLAGSDSTVRVHFLRPDELSARTTR